MKVTILGGSGVVGSTAAYRIAQDGLAAEIVLVSGHRNLSEAHAIDIEQAMLDRAPVCIHAGDLKDSKDSNVIIIAVSSRCRSSVSSRNSRLRENLPLVLELTEAYLAESSSAIWIIATNPVDPLVYILHQTFSIPRQKVIGLNWNDSVRFRWAIARTLCVPSTVVEGFVLGEHAGTQVPLFSRVKIHGERVLLKPEQMEEIRTNIVNFIPQWIKLHSGRTAGWTTAESIGGIFKSIVSADEKIWVCSTPLGGEYGLSDVSLGVPMRLSSEGVQNIIEFDLDPEEKNALEASSLVIKRHIQEGKELLNRLEKDSRCF